MSYDISTQWDMRRLQDALFILEQKLNGLEASHATENVRIKCVADPNVWTENDPIPALEYKTAGASAIDLSAAEDILIPPMSHRLVKTGFSVAIPQGFEGQVRPRSGLALKHSITVLNTPGTIDSDFTGQIGVILLNLSPSAEFQVRRRDRIAQLAFVRVTHAEFEFVQNLAETKRGAGGFGSTGR